MSTAQTVRFVQLSGGDIDVKDGNVDAADHFGVRVMFGTGTALSVGSWLGDLERVLQLYTLTPTPPFVGAAIENCAKWEGFGSDSTM